MAGFTVSNHPLLAAEDSADAPANDLGQPRIRAKQPDSLAVRGAQRVSIDYSFVDAGSRSRVLKVIPSREKHLMHVQRREQHKDRLYRELIESERGAIFVPMVFTINGAAGRRTLSAIKLIIDALATKYGRPDEDGYRAKSRWANFVRCQVSCAAVKAASDLWLARIRLLHHSAVSRIRVAEILREARGASIGFPAPR